MPGGIGLQELIVILVILLIIFGPKRLPGLGRSLGSGMREFKDSISGRTKDEDDELERPALEQRTAAATVTEHRASDEPVTEPRP